LAVFERYPLAVFAGCPPMRAHLGGMDRQVSRVCRTANNESVYWSR